LRNSTERFLVITDTHGRILFADPAFVQSTGRAFSEVVGLPISKLLSHEYAALLSDRIAKVVSTGMPENFEVAKGVRYTENSLFPICDGGGTIVQLALVGNDITKRKQAEEALHESQQMMRLVLDTIPVRVFWKDTDSNYQGCNQSFAQDSGLSSPEELVGKNDWAMGWVDQAEAYRADDRLVINYRKTKTQLRGTADNARRPKNLVMHYQSPHAGCRRNRQRSLGHI
jgi:PAS domain S-box-containing protein